MQQHNMSTPNPWVGQPNLGFVINTTFSAENTEIILQWLEGLRIVAPEGLFTMNAEALHITVLDWVAPLFDYSGQDKRALFDSLYPQYHATFKTVTSDLAPFAIAFNEVRVTPGTIILVGKDNGSFAQLRQRFTSTVSLPKGAKEPPSIVHSSLARFIEPAIELTPLQKYVDQNPLHITQQVTEFRLLETRIEPTQDFDVLERYALND